MITNSEPGYFRALIPFERDPLPSATPSESAGAALGDLQRVRIERGAGAAQPPGFRNPLPAGGCARELFLSQLEPLETV